jgi:hypothetical protein
MLWVLRKLTRLAEADELEAENSSEVDVFVVVEVIIEGEELDKFSFEFCNLISSIFPNYGKKAFYYSHLSICCRCDCSLIGIRSS